MAYLKDYKGSKLLNDPFIDELMIDIMSTKSGEYTERVFAEKTDAKRIRNNVLVLLNGMKMEDGKPKKENYCTTLFFDGKMFWTLKITNVESIRKNTRAYYKGR